MTNNFCATSARQNHQQECSHSDIVIVSAIRAQSTSQIYASLDFFKKLTVQCIIFYTGSDFTELKQDLANKYPFVTLATQDYQLPSVPENVGLPRETSTVDDTASELIAQHLKVAFMRTAVDQLNNQSKMLIWMDFDIHLILSDHTDNILKVTREVSLQGLTKSSAVLTKMIFPGNWEALSSENLATHNIANLDWLLHKPHWRFIGAVFMGSQIAISEFWALYEKHFTTFLKAYGVLTWEVNFWAWLEATVSSWEPIWYKANYDISLLALPGQLYSSALNNLHSYKSKPIVYPAINGYYPMSAAYLNLDGQHWLNTRCVNYWLQKNGVYWLPPEDQKAIRTVNVLSKLDDNLDPLDFVEMTDQTTLINHYGYVQGIEDVRLFKDAETQGVRYLASNCNHSASGKTRIVVGEYNVDAKDYAISEVIAPPTNTDCEKNWIPIKRQPKEQTLSPEQWYIYQWCPLQVGQLEQRSTRERAKSNTNDTGATKLVIKISHPTNPLIFGRLRGSSCFIEATIEGVSGLLGVTHFSDDSIPRKYYHRLILLNPENFKPLKYSRGFYFENNSVEFCIGFTQLHKQYIFWVSQMDRDPIKVSVLCNEFRNWIDV